MAKRSDTAGHSADDSRTGTSRRELVLEAALHVFNEKGYRAATLNEIASRLNLSGPALYYYFARKQDILVALMRRPVTKLLSQATAIVSQDNTPTNHLIALMRSHLSLVFDETEAFSVLVRERVELSEVPANDLNATEREYELTLRDVYTRGVETGEFRDLDVKIAVLTMLGTMNWALRWYDPQGPLSRDGVVDQIISVVLLGVSQPITSEEPKLDVPVMVDGTSKNLRAINFLAPS